MREAMHLQYMSLNSSCTRTVCKWITRSNGHLTLQIWIPCKCHVWWVMHKVFF